MTVQPLAFEHACGVAAMFMFTLPPPPQRTFVEFSRGSVCWAAANGGVTNGGLRGVWPPLLEIGQNRPFSPFFCLFRPFPEGAKSTWEIQKTQEKAFFLRCPQICLNPHLVNPHLGHPKSENFPWQFSVNC